MSTNRSHSITAVTLFRGKDFIIPPLPSDISIGTVDVPAFYNVYTDWSETIDSVSTPNYWLRKPVRYVYVPKRGKLRPEPTKPVLRPPRIPELKPRKLGQSDKSWRRALRKYRISLDKYYQKLAQKQALYTKRLAKYERLLVLYNKQQLLVKQGVVRLKRVRNMLVKPNNPYSRTRTTFSPLQGQYSIITYYRKIGFRNWQAVKDPKVDWTGVFINGNLQPYYPNSYTVPDIDSRDAAIASAESAAISKIYDKLGSQDVHIGNILAERHQTLSLIADVVKRVASLRRGISNQLISFNKKSIASDILAFNFGVKPLIEDAYGLGIALAKIQSEGSDRIIVRARSKGASSGLKREDTTLGGQPWRTVYTQLHTEVVISYVLEYKISNGALSTLQSLGLINPAEIAWEVLPWSFVVDWFLPIGDYIHSFSADAGLEFVTGTKTTTITDAYTRTVSWDHPADYDGDSHYKGSAFGSKKVQTKVREVLTTPPTPRFPAFKNPFSPTHIVNSLALLTQRLR